MTVIRWRDIPAQVVVRDGRQTHKIVLHPRFQVAIDRAAAKAGRREWDDYLSEWRKEQRTCSGDVETEATAEAARLEAAYTAERLKQLVSAGGLDEVRQPA